VATFAALASALLAVWPGGRLIMRVLAFTSPDSAQGRLTEAQANVGFPTLEGSLILFVVAGLPAGYLVAILFVVLHRWLPAGRLAGPLLGSLVLIWLGALLDPLRADNIDFNGTRLARSRPVRGPLEPALRHSRGRGWLVE
jgi:hypothetical protein